MTDRPIEPDLAVAEDRRECSFDEAVALSYGEWVLMK